MAKPAVDIGTLSRDERLALLEQLWDSLSREAEAAVPLSVEQTAELDRRLDRLEQEEQGGISPATLRKRLRGDES